jgi:hypothetical protein
MGLVCLSEYTVNVSPNTISPKTTVTLMRSVLLKAETCSILLNCYEKEEIS